MREIKDMREAPPTIYHVSTERNMGWPNLGDPHGDGVPIVLSERESRSQGEGKQVKTVKTAGRKA